MGYRAVALALLASFAMAAPAGAVLVTSTNSATFAFDTSGLGAAFTITNGGYDCTASCPAGNNVPAPEALDTGATIQFDFGTTAGAADLGTILFTNPFGIPITNAAGGIFGAGGLAVTGPLATLFITMVFFDDDYGVDTLQIGTGLANLNGVLIPLPAALPLFLAGLAGLGLAGRRRKSAAA